MKTFTSDLSNREYPISEKISGRFIRPAILDSIREDHPEFTSEKVLAVSELKHFREKYIENLMTEQIGELSTLENKVLDSLKDRSILADDIDSEDVQTMTIGQRVADKVATFGGSWTFILSFMIFLFAWIALNIIWLANRGFDPYPFILLNLILSSLAALQAPVIMMSQNRQEEKDRERSRNDYMVNLKSELEIRMLHEKLDHLIINQQQEIADIHKEQMELMQNILKQVQNYDS